MYFISVKPRFKRCDDGDYSYYYGDRIGLWMKQELEGCYMYIKLCYIYVDVSKNHSKKKIKIMYVEKIKREWVSRYQQNKNSNKSIETSGRLLNSIYICT